MIKLKRLFFKILGKTPLDMEMVQHWKHGDAVQAKVMEVDGRSVMKMDGEKYIFPGFPRGWLLFGKLSKLKHEIKNQIFNESWAMLEEGKTEAEVMTHIRSVLPNIYAIAEEMYYDRLPISKTSIPVIEIDRAWSKIAPNSQIKDVITFILQEDDSYRWRFQWMVDYFGFGKPHTKFKRGLEWLEHGEVIGDMKERVRLVRRILLIIINDPENKVFFDRFFKEIDWKKIKLTKAEKYFFRAKYFKVDLDKFDY